MVQYSHLTKNRPTTSLISLRTLQAPNYVIRKTPRREAAKNLLELVIDTYAEMHNAPPNELFIHGQTYFNDEEWSAFCDAAPSETNVVDVRIRTTGSETKLFRDGDYPVLRGTALILDEQTAYLWTTGYVPQLDIYIGPETPNSLHITALRNKGSKPSIRSVLKDIMGLTKINYNSCNFNDGLPVTVRFAQMVGEVLTMGSASVASKSLVLDGKVAKRDSNPI